jgi:hypothetical protein
VVLCWLTENQKHDEKRMPILWIECPTNAIMGAGLLWPLRMGLVGSIPPMIMLSLVKCAIFFGGKISPNWNFENKILTYTKHISLEK